MVSAIARPSRIRALIDAIPKETPILAESGHPTQAEIDPIPAARYSFDLLDRARARSRLLGV
jgi:hypothetical protein